MGGALLFQSLALQTMATQFKTGEGIGKILAKMEQKFNVKFGYDASISDQKINELVNLEKLKKEEIAQFIRTISDGHLEVRKIDDKLYVVSKKGNAESESKKSHAAQKELRGKIVDQETNLPIGGATIRVKGTAIAATTDQMGAFKLSNVSDQAILQVSYIGYELSEVPATGASLIRLSKSSEALEEVVVTALGIKREQKALGYAVQDIKGDQLAKVKGVDVGTTLTGRVSGLRVMNSTEFNRAPDIQLRGKSPLLVIDGVAYENMSLRDIAVDNIENISVLKGSTAAALYGIEGAGGAIEEQNRMKSSLLYNFLDESKLFTSPVDPTYRSLMNIPFTTPSEELNNQFLQKAKERGFVTLKGHRSVGGMRASIYNAMPAEGVGQLVAYMKEFELENR